MLRHRSLPTCGLALLALTALLASACEGAPEMVVAKQEVEMCDLKRRNADPVEVPCLVVELDTEAMLVTTRAKIDGEEIAERSTTGLFWIPIETLPDAETLESVEVTFESTSKDSDEVTVTKLTFEIPPEFQTIVRDRLGAVAERERATAEATKPTFEVNADGDGFSTEYFGGEYFGCGGSIYPPKFNKGEGISINIRDCPDTVTIDGEPAKAKNLFRCENIIDGDTTWHQTDEVSFEIAIEHAGEVFSGTLKTTSGGCWYQVLEPEGGMIFDGETATTTQKPKVIQYENTLVAKDREPAEITLSEIDWIADIDSESRDFECNYGKVTRTRSENDKIITLRDRRTGEEMASKRFKARKGRCDKKTTVQVNTTDNTAMAVGDTGDNMSTYPSGKKITAWLESFM